ncbi:hypothetical protein [Aliiglaciecola litoralis]|uniref:Lipoprotein n=1 Tax=Aliiglaciecola litoralis TaxID=582857 RepID=A0ABP3X5S9_9ALTE
MRVAFLCITLVLVGCSSTQKNTYDLVFVKPQTDKIILPLAAKTDGGFKIYYQKDANGHNITKTLNRSTIITGNDTQTLKDLEDRAKKEIVQIATEEVNGVVIRSTSKIDTTVVEVSSGGNNTRYSRQEFTEDAVAQTAGIAQIRNLQCETLPSKGLSLIVKCSADVTVPLIKEIFIEPSKT